MPHAEIGLIGLAVMGANLARNMERNGFSVAVYNRSPERTRAFLESRPPKDRIQAAFSLADLVSRLTIPRRVLLMVQAGPPVDAVIAELKPLLSPGDLILDGGNSHFSDTERRATELSSHGIHYLGVGISGGESGALWGPAIMPGGSKEGYPLVEPILTAVAARVENTPCISYLGPGGAGHYVKMVHNGIEYADMALIAETYHLIRSALGMSTPEAAEVFDRWNRSPLASYLVEITARVLAKTDPETGNPLVEMILDAAGSKGTGMWTAAGALELGVPVPTIAAALEMRNLSAMKDQRRTAAGVLPGPPSAIGADRDQRLSDLAQALYFGRICTYAQGMALLNAASKAYGYGLHLSEILSLWREGCIIRAYLLETLQKALQADPGLPNLLLAPELREDLEQGHACLRRTVALAVRTGTPAAALAASLSYYDTYRCETLPANLIQAQRDCFGAHTYHRTDRKGIFHTDWEV